MTSVSEIAAQLDSLLYKSSFQDILIVSLFLIDQLAPMGSI
jgi:hypothetical protein